MSEQTLSPAQQIQLDNRDSSGKWKEKAHGAVEADDVLGLNSTDDEVLEGDVLTVNYSFPDAVQVLPADATREEWLQERKKGVGGSDASALVGQNRYKDVLDVYEDKTGQAEPIESNYKMRRGLAMEPGMREEFTRVTGLETQRRGLLRSKSRPHMQVSVDSMTSDGGILEIKTTGFYNARDWSEEEGRVPPEAYWQVQHAMSVTGRSHAWVAADIGGEFELVRVERNEDDIAELNEATDEFWDRVQSRIPPAPQSLDKIQELYAKPEPGKRVVATDEVVEAVEEFEVAKEDEKAAKERQKTARAVIEGHMKDAEELVDGTGHRLATNKQNGTFAPAKFEKAHPDLAEEYKTTKTVVDTDRLKKEQPSVYAEFRSRRFVS